MSILLHLREIYYYFFSANAWYEAIISFCTNGSTALCVRYSIVNSPLPCVIPRSWEASGEGDGVSSWFRRWRQTLREVGEEVRTAKHVVQADFSGEGELLISNLSIDDRSLALIDTTNDGTYRQS